jgi:hypothetical protein
MQTIYDDRRTSIVNLSIVNCQLVFRFTRATHLGRTIAPMAK